MPPYVEERQFSLRLDFRCAFAEDYEGEEDGGQWADVVPTMTAAVVAAAIKALAPFPGWSVRPSNRGRDATDEVTFVLERTAAP